LAVVWDEDLDCEGLLCPLPVLRARKRLLGMVAGQVLRVRTTDRMALVDLPHFCGEGGHDYLEGREEGAVIVHLIRRGVGRPDLDGL
jgi:tRNA 2-thiouridine synthesizing protein A